jgi:hypothetical protein
MAAVATATVAVTAAMAVAVGEAVSAAAQASVAVELRRRVTVYLSHLCLVVAPGPSRTCQCSLVGQRVHGVLLGMGQE